MKGRRLLVAALLAVVLLLLPYSALAPFHASRHQPYQELSDRPPKGYFDTDGDLLWDGNEPLYGTDPEVVDTDDDLFPDGVEVAYWLGKASELGERGERSAHAPLGDPDGDGLPNVRDPDSDGDGLPDGWEAANGLDPASARTNPAGAPDAYQYYSFFRGDTNDRDRDYIPDGWEVAFAADDPGADLDGDGVTNAGEYLNGTDPRGPDALYGDVPTAADTDGDGVTDPVERALGLDPGSRDTDGDGLPDVVELGSVYLGGSTDPNNPDTDGDGLLDGQEDRNRNGRREGNAPNDRDSDWGRGGETDPTIWDTDGGGTNDQNEVWRGDDPLDPGDDRRPQPPNNPPPRPNVDPPPGPRPVDLSALVWVMVVIAFVVLGLLLAMMLYKTATTKEGFLEEVLEALREGERVLYDVTLSDDVREAIFQAYRAFLEVMARHGHVREDPTTAREFARAVREAVAVDDEALHAFTVMFEVARYSDHELGMADRDRALGAFAAVRASVEGATARWAARTAGTARATEGPATGAGEAVPTKGMGEPPRTRRRLLGRGGT